MEPTGGGAWITTRPSPLLANVMLDPLDKMIEAMGLPFARYADDFLIVTKTKAEALTAMAAVEEYVEGRLKLLVNREKSKVAPLAYAESLQWDKWILRRVRLCYWKDWKGRADGGAC